ncbi:LysR substrate-binding domain-containing protein [Kocuria palustris]|uniref:LysR substrate-binding domain-containing protein n=1 Tax=Kocuria palustris TaxID=71999 RepID=UPI0035D86321
MAEGLKIVHQRWPAIEIQVRSALRPQLIDMLHTGKVELALMWSYSWTGATEQSLSLVPVATDRTVLLVAADSSLGKVVSLPALRDLRWIIRHDQHPASEVLSRSCEAASFAPRVVYGASDYQELQPMVAAGGRHRDGARAGHLPPPPRRADPVLLPCGPDPGPLNHHRLLGTQAVHASHVRDVSSHPRRRPDHRPGPVGMTFSRYRYTGCPHDRSVIRRPPRHPRGRSSDQFGISCARTWCAGCAPTGP